MKQSISLFIILIVILSSIPVQAADLYVVAVFDLKPETGVSEQTAQTLSNLLRKDLAATHKMVVMDRNDMEGLLKEQGRNLDECSEEGCAVELGQMLDTDKILVGNVSLLGGRYMLYAKMVDIESGAMIFAKNVQGSNDESELVTYVTQLAEQIAGEILLTGKVLEINENEVLVDLGGDVGIQNGATLIVDRQGSAISDPETGELRGYNWDEIARLQVIGSTGASISRCQIVSSMKDILPSDRVREYAFGGVVEQRGDVIFTMEPGDVDVVINGSPSGTVPISESGRMKMKFSAGSYSFIFSRSGKQNWSKDVVVKAGGTVEVPVEFIAGKSEKVQVSGYGILVVRSEPTGATIRIDGVERGMTTLQVKQIAAGTHTIEINKALYKPYRETLTVESDDILNVEAELEPDFGKLSIASNPSGAMVYIDGQQKGLTPHNVERYQSGEYDLKVIKQLFHEHNQKFTVDAGGSTPISVNLKPAFGSLKITSNPSGARVIVDEQNWGMTPIQRDTILSGRHTVVLKMDLFNDYEEIVMIQDGKLTQLDAVLKKDFGTLDISSTPKGADIFFKGQRGKVGTTPTIKKMKQGVYTIQIQKDDYESFEQSVNLSIGDTKVIAPNLVRKTGRLVIFTEPPDAEVYLGTEHLGKSPQIVKQHPTGTYELVMKLPEYADHHESIVITHKQETNIDVTLSKTAYLAKQKVKRQAILMSLILPGSGQLRSRQAIRGIVYIAAFVGTAYMTYDNLGKFNDSNDEYDAAKAIYDDASDQHIITNAITQMRTSQSDMTDFDQQHKLFFFAAGGIWAWNVIDALIWGGGKAETFASKDSPIKLVVTPNRVGVTINF